MIHINTMRPPEIPAHLWPGLREYILYGSPTGGFLTAVLENKLRESIGRADHISRDALQDIVGWLYQEAPNSCWGSPERVAAWVGMVDTVMFPTTEGMTHGVP